MIGGDKGGDMGVDMGVTSRVICLGHVWGII